jgi:hypothetical protein
LDFSECHLAVIFLPIEASTSNGGKGSESGDSVTLELDSTKPYIHHAEHAVKYRPKTHKNKKHGKRRRAQFRAQSRILTLKKGSTKMAKPLILLVPGAGIEPAKEAIIISDNLCYVVI